MSKNAIITLLAVVAGVLLACLLLRDIWKPPVVDAGEGFGEKKPKEGSKLSPKNPEKKDPVTGGDVDRLPKKREIKNEFLVSGKGYYAKWGKGLKAGFQQKGEFVAEAVVVDKKKLGNGRFKVVEDRTFTTARETLEIGDADYFLALDTLPIDEISSGLETVGKAVGAISGFLAKTAQPKLVAAGKIGETIGGVSEMAAAGFRYFKISNNGKTLKELGLDLSQDANRKVKSAINDFSRKPKEIETIVRKVEGRTYRFTYIQDGFGKPLNVTAERLENGKTTPLETEEEVWILCRCNAFIDAEFLKDKNGKEVTPKPGDKWDINAESVASIVGADGYCKGDLRCCRSDSGENEIWEVTINPAELDVVDDSGRKLGKISVGGGKATVNGAERLLRDVTIKGTGKLSRVNKNSILYLPFNEKFVGDCHFSGKMTTTEIK